MTKSQIKIQDGESGFESIFQGSFGLPIMNIVTEHVKKLQDAITEQQEKAGRLLKENNTLLSSKHVH
jgi:hypothetical protein